MWTVYLEDEVVDLMSDRELAALMHEAETADHMNINVVLDLIREVAVIS